MLNLKSKLASATAAALFVAIAPFAHSADLWHQLEMTDGYTPTPAQASPFQQKGVAAGPAVETYFEHERQITDGAAPNADHEAMKAQAAREGKVSEIRAELGKESTHFCLSQFEQQLRMTDGYTPTRC